MSPRHDLYTMIHKGVRALLAELAMEVAHAATSSDSDAARLRHRVARAVAFQREHAEHEDTHVAPLIERAAPALFAALTHEHAALERRLDRVLALAVRLSATAQPARREIGCALHGEVLALIEDQLRHMRREETEVNDALWSAYDDETLAAISQAIQRDIPLPRLIDWLEILLPALSFDERLALLGGIRADAPHLVAGAVFDASREILGESWPDLAARLRAPGPPPGAQGLHTLVLTTTLSLALFATACSEDRPTDPAPPSEPETAATARSRSGEEPTVAATPAAPSSAPADARTIARGDYLVNTVMACGACHTPLGADGRPDPTRLFAGGLEIPETFGTWRSPNITQDRRTGIGDWTDAEIAAAIREGRKPSGDRLYAIMPYAYYHAMSDDDVGAVVAYLRTVEPVEQAVAGNTDLKLPKIPMPPAPGKRPGTSPVERGAYFASLMHCGQCHTPMSPEGSPDMSRPLAGGMEFPMPPFLGTGSVFAANLTPDETTGVGGWTDEELLRSITSLTKRDGEPIAGPMAMLGARWRELEPADATAVVAYLRTLTPVANRVPASTFRPIAR